MSDAPRDATAFEVREALGKGGCAVCRLSLRAVSRSIGTIAYEQVNDLDLRQQLRKAGGFCNAHAHQWLREARSVLGTALIYRDVLQAALADMEVARPSDTPRGGLLRSLWRGASGQSDGRCPACQVQAEAEGRYLEALLALVGAEPELLEGSAGVCRRHALAAARSSHAAGAYVLSHTCQSIAAMLADLDEVIRKEDYRFRDEARTEGERTAPARAIAWAAGAEGLVNLPF